MDAYGRQHLSDQCRKRSIFTDVHDLAGLNDPPKSEEKILSHAEPGDHQAPKVPIVDSHDPYITTLTLPNGESCFPGSIYHHAPLHHNVNYTHAQHQQTIQQHCSILWSQLLHSHHHGTSPYTMGAIPQSMHYLPFYSTVEHCVYNQHPPVATHVPPSLPNRPPVKQAPRFQCPDCNRSYSTFSGLSKHRQFHCISQMKRQFSCKYCEKKYASLGALKMHIRTHTLPCKCHLCGKAFSRPWLLQGHLRTHTGEKPFGCGHCGRAFADRSNLRAHLQTHSDVKKYRCKTCQKTFSRMSLLNKHTSNGCPGTLV